MANIILTPKPLRPLQQVMLLHVKWAGAAGGWGGAAGGRARPVAQLDPGAHICPRLPILEEPLEAQPWPAFRLDNLLALGRALHGIFQPSPSLLAFTVPSSIDLKNPKSLFCFLALSNPLRGPAELHSQAVCPRFPIHSQSVRSRFRKVFASVTHHTSACGGLLHWDKLSWREAVRGWWIGWKNIKAQCSLEAARQHDPVV